MEFLKNFIDLFQLNFKFIIPLLMLAVIDLILGLTKGHYIEGISSAKMKQTIPKFVRYIGFTLLCLILDSLIMISPVKLPFTDISYITTAALIYSCCIEMRSINENLVTLGLDIPKFIKNAIEELKKGVDKDNE